MLAARARPRAALEETMSRSRKLISALDEARQRLGEVAPTATAAAAPLERAHQLAVEADDAYERSQRELDALTNQRILTLRLFEDLRREKVVEAIFEMVVNVVGCEDFILYLDDGTRFDPATGMGSTRDRALPFERSAPWAAPLLTQTRPSFDEEGWVARINLRRSSGESLGLLMLKTLLPQCPALTPAGRELLTALQVQAEAALSVTPAVGGR